MYQLLVTSSSYLLLIPTKEGTMKNLYRQPRSKFKRMAIATSALMAFTTIGCTQSNENSDSSTARRGGSIRVGIFDSFPGFCVSNNPANSALMAERTIYETLFERTTGGEMVGLLALNASSSNDLKTWTVNLRQGINFTDGTPFDANAVVANFNAITGRIAAAAFAAGGLAGYQTKAYTVGTGTAFTANINSITAQSPYVVEFGLDRAQNDFASTLYASGRFFMRSPAQLNNATTCANTPIGTGPFKLTSWTSDQMVVTRNTDYWRRDPINNNQLPYLDEITFTNIKETSQRTSSVRTGTLDAAMFSSATDGTFIKDLRLRKSDINEYKSEVEYYPSLWLNQGKAGSPFANMAARKAVLSCIDRVNYLKVRNKGEGTVATSIVGPTSVMFSRSGFPDFSIEDSKVFVAQYKQETGKDRLEFTFPADTTSISQANAAFLKSTWARCGISANFTVEETALIITKAFNAAPNAGSGEYYNAYDALLLTLFEGNDVAFNLPFIVTNSYPASSTNPVSQLFKNSVGVVLGLNHHSDTTVDKLFYEGEAASSQEAAGAKYREGTAYLQETAVMGSITHSYYTLFTSKEISGVGKLQIEDGKTQREITNWGIDWTGVWKSA